MGNKLRYPRRRELQGKRQLLQGRPIPRSEEEERLIAIVTTYFRRCAEYRETCCTLLYKGWHYPATTQEQLNCEAYAEYVLHDLMQKHDLTREQMLEAIRKFAREVLDGQPTTASY